MSRLILDLLSTVALCIKHFILCEGRNTSTVDDQCEQNWSPSLTFLRCKATSSSLHLSSPPSSARVNFHTSSVGRPVTALSPARAPDKERLESRGWRTREYGAFLSRGLRAVSLASPEQRSRAAQRPSSPFPGPASPSPQHQPAGRRFLPACTVFLMATSKTLLYSGPATDLQVPATCNLKAGRDSGVEDEATATFTSPSSGLAASGLSGSPIAQTLPELPELRN